MQIKNIIFDLGGVLLPIDYVATTNAFAAFGVPEASVFYSQQAQKPLFDRFEKGEISGAEFVFELKKLFPSVAENELLNAWNALLGVFPAERLKLLKKAATHYRIFLLSNTNSIHINRFLSDLKGHAGIEDFHAYFEQVYYSFETGFRKPEKEIFDLVLLENNLNAGETVFLEDTKYNVDGALAAGIPTVWVKVNEGQNTEDLFDANGKFTAENQIIYP